LEKKTASSAIAHPARVQILVIANERDVSPSSYVEEVMGLSPAKEPADYKRALSHVSYHFRALEKAGCIVIIDRIPKRGAVEHVYRAVERARFSDEEWAEVPQDERCRIMTVAWQGLMARTEAARMAHTLQGRDDTWLAWTDAKLDDRGWAEMTTTIAANYAELERIRQESEARLQETEGEAIPATFAMLGYESPVGHFYEVPPPGKEK
jgi:acyl-CoA reductase-like NAD-dependent aldehyde dehydrogenase